VDDADDAEDVEKRMVSASELIEDMDMVEAREDDMVEARSDPEFEEVARPISCL
jgi:hypothetical protein